MKNERNSLYFPSIEFRDIAWLKSSLVLCDSIYRIVPHGYIPQDDDEIREAIDLGLVKSIYLTDDDRETTAAEFKKFVDALEYLPVGIDLPDGSNQQEHIHVDKIDRRLYPLLESLAGKFGQDGWLKIPRSVAKGYMYFLADITAKKRGLHLTTDDSDSWVINGFYSEGGNLSEFVYDRNAKGFLSALTIQNLIPASIEQASIKDIAKFSQKYRDEKERFKIAMESLSIELSAIQNPQDAKEKIILTARELENSKEDLRKALSFAGPEVQSSLLSYGVPVSAGIYMSLGGDPFDLARLSASVLIGAVAAYGDYNRASRNRKQNPLASYLLDLDKELIRTGKFRAHHRVMEEFIND